MALGSVAVTVALPSSCDGIALALMADHMSRQVLVMSIWASSLTDPSANTRKGKLEKGLLAMQDQPATWPRMENDKRSSSSLDFSPGNPKI